MDRKKAEELVLKRYKSLLIIAHEVLEEGKVNKFFSTDEAKKQMVDMINNLTEGAYLSLKFIVKLKYRLGRMGDKEGVWEKDEKTVEAALKNGFEIPAEAICVEIEVKPQAKIKGIAGKTETKTLNATLYKRRIYLMEKEMSVDLLKQRYGITDDDFVFNVSDFDNSKLFKFQGVNCDATI